MIHRRIRRRNPLLAVTLCAIAISAFVALVALALLAAPNGIG
jgi:hypothetical protein